ncbi:hypothetical protein CC79DRAFT_1402301 [Sarocladium strictum]
MRLYELRAAAAALFALSPGALSQSANPNRRELRRRALGDSVVLGNHLYIEGGEVSQEGDSDGNDGEFSRPFNLSLSIPLDSSWQASSVEITEIKRGKKPNNKFNSLWADEDGNRIFQWDGEGSYGDTDGAEQRKLWTMNVNGSGGGEWTAMDEDDFEDQGTYSSIRRNAQSAAVVCNGTAYSIGGFESSATDSRLSDDGNGNVPTREMFTFDLETQTWNQSSLEAMSPPNGVFIRGKATCVEGFGDNPLVFTSGGAISSKSTTRNGVQTLDPTNITFYDTQTEQWLWQKATGDIPSGGRQQHCMVGARSSSGSYELFVYGGYDYEEDILDDIWVLTLPGFHWIRVETRQSPRVYHNCVLAGNRQMVVVGGLPGFSGEAWAWAEEDEFANGIAVFDLTKLEWSDGYDANANSYVAPESVRKWYNDGGMNKVEWSSDVVENMFGSVELEVDTAPSPSSAPKPSDSASEDEADDESSDSSSSTPTGAIAGGVVGGVAALGLLGTVLFCLRRRRRNTAMNEKGPLPFEVEGNLPTDGSSWSSPPAPPPKDTNVSPRSEFPRSHNTPSPLTARPEGSIGNFGPYEMPAQNMHATELDTSGFPGFKKQAD